jgi:peptidoglycan/xylan/chitin deacetylase (PgdA/CDA1 family)
MFDGILSGVRRTSRRAIPGGAILSFHSITTPGSPAAAVEHVSLDAFKSFIRCLRAVSELVPLSEFVRRSLQGRDTSGLIAVTLDDAYAALAGEFSHFVTSEGIPIAIFVISRAAERGQTFWWDRIDDLHPCVQPDRWRAFEAACGLPEIYRRGQPREFGPLRPLRQWVLAKHAGRWPAHLEPHLRGLEREVDHRTHQRAMTFDDLTTLTKLPGVEIGVHTMSHPVLPLLPDSDLRQEIAGSHDALRDRFSSVLPVVAIPFGLYDARTLRAARDAGMTASLTLAGDTRGHDPAQYVLSRFCVTRGDTCTKLALRLSGLRQAMRPWSRLAPAPYPALPSATS